MALRGALTHRKTRRLGQTLSIDACLALGLMESLWHVAGEQGIPNGGVGRMTDQDMAMEMFYSGDATKLVQAFVSSGLLDEHVVHRLIVHDWHVHSDDATDNKLARAGECYANGAKPRMRRLAKHEREFLEAKYPATLCDSVGTDSHGTPPPVPVPVPVPVKEPPRGKRESKVHHLFAYVKDLLMDYYRNRNQVDAPWGPGETKQLTTLLAEQPDVAEEYWKGCVLGRSQSDVNHAERPRVWIANLPSYRVAVNAFNRPKEVQALPLDPDKPAYAGSSKTMLAKFETARRASNA